MTATPAPTIRIGEYTLHERLGEGGAGQVHRATDARGTSVAIKLLGPSADLEPEAARARFRREVEILRTLDHPALVSLVDHGLDDELGPYLVMPLVPGQTLRALIAGGKLCPEAAILLVEPIASAVAALHARSLVHRDLKPENVMVTPDGKVVVVDLGLAWGPELSRHTAEGTAVGSVPYMAPEQIEGTGVGTAADIWALGVILYELVAGKRPFARARAAEEAAAALVGAYAPLDAVDPRCAPELTRLVARSLERAPAARPTADTFAAELATAIDWIEPADRPRERAAIALAPAGYVQRVAPFRIRREKRLAREAIAAARPFQALAHVDRALAYAPHDPELLSLAAEAESRSSQPSPSSGDVPRSVEAAGPVEVRPLRRSGVVPIVLATIASAVVAVGATVFVMVFFIHPTPDTPNSDPAEVRTALAHDAGVPVAEVPADAAAVLVALADAGPSSVTSAPIAGLVLLSPAGIPNTGVDRLDSMKAAPGEHLVPEDRLEAGSPAKAIAEIDADVAANPDRKNLLGQAMVYIAAGRTADGLAKLDALLAKEPGYADAWGAKGYVEVRAGHARAAEAAMTKAIELNPDDAASYRNRGILRDHQGRSREAYADLLEALRRDPTDVEAMSELAQVYQVAGHREDARPLLERIVKSRPQSATAWLDLSMVQPASDALESIKHALAVEPKSARGYERLCTVLAEGGSKDAIPACTNAVTLGPDDPWAWMGRGLARYQLANDKHGLDDVDHAIALAPDQAQFYINRYILRSHAGMLAEAKQDLQKACKLGKPEACTQLGKLP